VGEGFKRYGPRPRAAPEAPGDKPGKKGKKRKAA
jgi:hypothetical protein